MEAGDLAGECGLRELVRALLEEEEDEEREAERERGRGKISGGRFGLGTRVFDDEDGRHVATALTRRRRRPTRGRVKGPVARSSLRGGGGELGTNKNLDLWLQLVWTKLKLKHATRSATRLF